MHGLQNCLPGVDGLLTLLCVCVCVKIFVYVCAYVSLYILLTNRQHQHNQASETTSAENLDHPN